MAQAEQLPLVLTVRPWIDPLVEEGGVRPTSSYVEYCWLPVLGPTCTWLYRRLGGMAARNDGEHRVDTVELARSLGLGQGLRGRADRDHPPVVGLARF